MKDEEYYKLLDKIVRYCSYAERCLSDVNKKLYKSVVNQEVQQKIITYLIENDIVDERRYALSYTLGKLRYNKWGRVKINAQLRGKRISPDDIDFALSNIEPEEYQDILVAVLTKKSEALGDDAELFSKVVRHAQSRGFELNNILAEMKNRQ